MSTITDTASVGHNSVAGPVAFEQITGLPATGFLDEPKDLASAFGRFVMQWEFADV